MHEETKVNELEAEVLYQEVIRLHDVARNLERVFGQPGRLSDDIRHCADRLSELLKRETK